MLDYDIGADNVHVGPSDYVPWLTDRKWAFIRMEGSSFGDVPLNIEMKLEVWDSPNSAGIVIDAVRMAKLALSNGVAGALEDPSSYLMKSPPKQIVDDEAYDATERFIAQYARQRREGRGSGLGGREGGGMSAAALAYRSGQPGRLKSIRCSMKPFGRPACAGGRQRSSGGTRSSVRCRSPRPRLDSSRRRGRTTIRSGGSSDGSS